MTTTHCKQMKEPSIIERFDLWRFAYSRSSFIESRQTARLLLKIQEDIILGHRTALLTALVVTYARPFTKAQITKETRIIPMHDMPVPSEHSNIHQKFLELRNQVFGHKDATGPDTGDGKLNRVLFIIKNGHLELHTVKADSIDQASLKEIELLTGKLITNLDSKIADFMAKYPFPNGNGHYALNLDVPSEPWISKK